MIPLRNGYPLWYPQPNYNLPIEYRHSGISIGDVEIITPDGGFDFLFNVLLPYDHPVNMLAGLPPGFNEPIRPNLLTRARTSYTGSSTISNLKNIKTDFNESSSQISFICTDGDAGAILALPEGASEDDLSNEWHWKQFISKNGLTWYRYIRENCGRDLDRQSLYFVTGHTKSKSWGILTFNTPVPERNDVLVMGKSVDANGPLFVWKKVEGASVYKSGPSLDSGLISEVDRMGNENQCLFLRGFKISLSEQARKELWGDDQGVLFPMVNSDHVPIPHGSLESQGTLSSIPPHNQYSKEVSISSFPRKVNQAFHPSNAINDHLFTLAPDSRTAVTHDNVWLDVAASVDFNNTHMLGVIVGSQFVTCYHEDTAMKLWKLLYSENV